MADNVTFQSATAATPASGTKVATDEDGSSAHHQYVKIEFGGDGTFTKVSSTDPLPVTNSTWGLSTDTASLSDGTAPATISSGVKRTNELLYAWWSDKSLQRASITATASGDTQVVAASTGQRIVPFMLEYTVSGTTKVKWVSGSSPPVPLQTVSIGMVLPWAPGGWFESASGSALSIHLDTTGVTAAGTLSYYLQD